MSIVKIRRMQVLARPVRVLCPKGHRICTIMVRDYGDRLGIGLQTKGLRAQKGGRWDDVYRHDPDTGQTLRQVEIDCPHRTCGYTGRIGYAKLVADLAAVLARSTTGHAEHRLTT